MDTVMIVLCLIFAFCVFMFIVKLNEQHKKRNQKDAEVKAVQDVTTEKTLEAKRIADEYVYSDIQNKRRILLKRFENCDAPLENIPDDLMMVLGYDEAADPANPKKAEIIGIFADEVLPSKAMKDKYHLIPMSREEFAKAHPIQGVAYNVVAHRETNTIHVQDKPKSVVGGAVKGAVVAGGVGAVVGAIATADKNSRAKGRDVTYETGRVTYTGDHYIAIEGNCFDDASGTSVPFCYRPKFLWIHDAVIEKYLINGTSMWITPKEMTKLGTDFPILHKHPGEHRQTMNRFHLYHQSGDERNGIYRSQNFERIINAIMEDDGTPAIVRQGSLVTYEGLKGQIHIYLKGEKVRVVFASTGNDRSSSIITESRNPKAHIEGHISDGSLKIREF